MKAFDYALFGVIITAIFSGIAYAIDNRKKILATIFLSAVIICVAGIITNACLRYDDSYIFDWNLKADNAAEKARDAASKADKAAILGNEAADKARDAQIQAISAATQAYGIAINTIAEQNPVSIHSDIWKDPNNAEDDINWVISSFVSKELALDGLGVWASEEYPAFDFYIGEFKYGVKNGLGINRFYGYDEDRLFRGFYAGYFRGRNHHGYGLMHWDTLWEGNYFAGKWDNAQRILGVTRLSSGDIYAGEHLDSVLHGYGDYKWADGSVYTGQWEYDKRNGYGVLKFAREEHEIINGPDRLKPRYDEIRYTGKFENHLPSGYGVLVFANGDYFEGEFLNGLCHGYGIMYGTNGKVIKKGLWEQDEYIGRG